MSEPFDTTARSQSRWLRGLIAGYLLLVFVGGSWPAPPAGPDYDDKTVHFVVFGVLAGLLVPVLRHDSSKLLVPMLLAITYSSLVGGALELWQSMLPYRTAEWADWVADTGGAVTGVGLVGLGAAVSRFYRSRP